MTNEKAIDVLMYFLNRLSGMHYIENGIEQPSYKTEAFSKAICSLAKEDKYKWHDIRKKPLDLPEYEEDVEVINEEGVHHIAFYKPHYYRSSNTYTDEWILKYCLYDGEIWDEFENMKIIKWRYIEPVEVEE